MSADHLASTNSAFMFGTFDPAFAAGSGSIRALQNALIGIGENDDLKPVVVYRHCHARAATDGSSSAFMFGGHPEQRNPTAPEGLLLNLWRSELD